MGAYVLVDASWYKAILLAFGKEIMDKYRTALADTLREATKGSPQTLIGKGWDSDFVRSHLPHMVHSTIQAGAGDSGDLVRAITDAALRLWKGNYQALDRTSFWTETCYLNRNVAGQGVSLPLEPNVGHRAGEVRGS
jgi:hypothetical protein